MKKFVMMTMVLMFAFISVSFGQNTERRAYTEHKRERHQMMQDGKTKCHKGKKYHQRKMRKMAAADGKITPRERRMLRKNRRVY